MDLLYVISCFNSQLTARKSPGSAYLPLQWHPLNTKFTAFSKEVYALIISVPLHILSLIQRIIPPMFSDEIPHATIFYVTILPVLLLIVSTYLAISIVT